MLIRMDKRRGTTRTAPTMVGSARKLCRSSQTSRQAECCFALDVANDCKYTCTARNIIPILTHISD